MLEENGFKAYIHYISFKAYMQKKGTSIDVLNGKTKGRHDINFELFRNDRKIFSTVEKHIGTNRWKCHVYYYAYWDRENGKNWHVTHMLDDNYQVGDKLFEELQHKEAAFRRDLEIIIKRCRKFNQPVTSYFFNDNKVPRIVTDKSVSILTKTLLDHVFKWSCKYNAKEEFLDVVELKKHTYYEKVVDNGLRFVYHLLKNEDLDKYKSITRTILQEA